MNKYWKIFFHRTAKDLKQRELLPLKLLFFMDSSTIFVLYPYLTIHMRGLGINVEETAIISAVIPVVSILMIPLAEIVVDKIGNFKVMLATCSIVCGFSSLLLLLIPVGRISIPYPNELVFGLSCGANSFPIMYLDQILPCYLRKNLSMLEAEFDLQSCGFQCHAILEDRHAINVLNTKEYGLQLYDLDRNTSVTYSFFLNDNDRAYSLRMMNENQTTLRNERFFTAIRKLSKNSYYFPTKRLFSFSCDIGSPNHMECILGSIEQMQQFNRRLENKWRCGVIPQRILPEDNSELRQIFHIGYISHNDNKKISCLRSNVFKRKHISITIPLNSTLEVKHLDLGTCSPRCIVTTRRKDICLNNNDLIDLNATLTFWSYLIVRMFIGIISSTSFAMFERAVITVLREHNTDDGLQILSYGGMISSPLSGFLIDFASRGKKHTDFRPMFFLYATLKIVTGFLTLFIDLEFKKTATSVVSDVLQVLKKVEVVALLTSCLILGSIWGFIENFLFWFLENIDGSKSLMGFTITVGGIASIPLLVLFGPIINKLGHANVIFIGFIFYAIRLVGYSLINVPWLCLIFEAMEVVTFGMSFTAAVTYAANLSTMTTVTSIQGMLSGLYYGVGNGIGSLIGGYLITSIGLRSTFQMFALAAIFTGLLYFAFYHLYIKKNSDIPQIKANHVDKKLQKEATAGFQDSLYNPAEENFFSNIQNCSKS